MMNNSEISPAELAARKSLDAVYQAIEQKKNFVLEAGAGAGKTYSLIKALNYIIAKKQIELQSKNQQVACITFTNVAKNEIRKRTDNHPAILSETIHSFCWALIADFQKSMRVEIPTLGDVWETRLNEAGGIGFRKIIYDLGHPKIEPEAIYLHHDDVIDLMVKLMNKQKFRNILSNRYPVIFIDEYQDTNKHFVDSLKTHFITPEQGPLLGFFGDHWQKIYGTNACGKIESEKLTIISKEANFRSDKLIVESLNRMRPELPQKVKDEKSDGAIVILHTNDWNGTRLTGNHWDGDLPSEEASTYRDKARKYLMDLGWNLAADETKILMLTHRLLAEEQGYRNLAAVFPNTESYIKKEDAHIEYFLDYLEPICIAYENRRYGEMFEKLGQKSPNIHKIADKVKWKKDFDLLIEHRSYSNIGKVLEHLRATQRPLLSEKIENIEKKILRITAISENERTDEDKKLLEKSIKFKNISYKEVIALSKFVEDQTLFATNHGVKGAEYENVFVIVGRGWNQYNFNQFLEWNHTVVPKGKEETYERNRNLFYVACSRPKSKLAILFTQKLSDKAMLTLKKWFGEESIVALQ